VNGVVRGYVQLVVRTRPRATSQSSWTCRTLKPLCRVPFVPVVEHRLVDLRNGFADSHGTHSTFDSYPLSLRRTIARSLDMTFTPVSEIRSLIQQDTQPSVTTMNTTPSMKPINRSRPICDACEKVLSNNKMFTCENDLKAVAAGAIAAATGVDTLLPLPRVVHWAVAGAATDKICRGIEFDKR
jgi:hypothetical protein